MKPILSIDSMKLTKDVVNSQTTANDIDQIFALYKATYPALTHIAISVPVSSNGDFIAHGNKPSPLTVEDFETLWVRKIHAQGWNVIFRGTFCEAEGIYNFPILQADSATWKAKVLAYITRITPLLLPGDVIAILPESTNNAFNGKLFLTGALPNTYNTFFTDLILAIKAQLNTVSTIKDGIPVYITNNFSEMNSGWIQNIPQAEGAVVIDHYGSQGLQTTAATMQADIEGLQKKFNLPVFLQEFSDINGIGSAFTQACAAMFTQEIAAKNMLGVNWWVGWQSPTEGILLNTNGTWSLNTEKANALKPFFANPAIPPFVYSGTMELHFDGQNFSATIKGKFQ